MAESEGSLRMKSIGLTIRWHPIITAFKKAWPTWLALGGIALSGWVGYLFSQSESETIRYAGTMLQFLGLTTVAIGLSETRRLFGRPSLPHKILFFFRQVASGFATPKPMTLQVHDLTCTPTIENVQLVRAASPEDSLEERVSILEENLNRLREELTVKKQEFQQGIQTVKVQIEREAQERRTENQQVTQKIEEVAVGGLHLETVGLLWLVLGVIATSIPGEIANIYLSLRIGLATFAG